MIGALLLMLLLRSRPQLRPLQDYLQRGQIDTADDGAQGSYGPTQHHFTDVRITPPSARGRAFNSLDAQRDACEAYIKSQAHEGWRLIRAIDGAIYEERAALELLFEIFDRADDLVRDAVVDRLGSRHPVVPVGVLADSFDGLSGIGGDDLDQSLVHLDELARLDLDVGCRAVHAAHRLMQEEAGIRQAEPHLILASQIDEHTCRRDPAGADHVDRHGRADELDDVMY